jgi:hypothetical protein
MMGRTPIKNPHWAASIPRPCIVGRVNFGGLMIIRKFFILELGNVGYKKTVLLCRFQKYKLTSVTKCTLKSYSGKTVY